MFITGGTGFVGKVLLEKLLRSTSVRRVYLLIRSKRGCPPSARLDTLLQSQLFDLVRAQGQEPGARVRAVQGDIEEQGLGLSVEDRARLCGEVREDQCLSNLLLVQVEVVLHCAATVRFDEILSAALSMNVSMVCYHKLGGLVECDYMFHKNLFLGPFSRPATLKRAQWV